ncbi:hypothetical protein Hokovirus_5_21 [Hokovirus HKV1]|uniref:Uncharacterized protein n=1 Tax=Hokovirus HKV1 TaxID=1977638 RepID=A0A1V0SHE3_9VIRU|nr:hypothetical protein Hokovirus_5_21 [Hokovirus HKV1]
MNGDIKFHKKDAKEKLAKYKMEKISSSKEKKKNKNEDNNISSSNEVNIVNKIICQEHVKFTKINTFDIKEKKHMRTLNNDIYNMVNSYSNTTFNEQNMIYDKNEKVNKIMDEVKNNITDDTLCVIICNKVNKT